MDGIFNVQIKDTFLGCEDHGIMTFRIGVENGYYWGIGNYDIRFTNRGAECIAKILRVVGVTSWEELPYTYCRIEVKDGRVLGIANILKDNWFEIDKYFESKIQTEEEFKKDLAEWEEVMK